MSELEEIYHRYFQDVFYFLLSYTKDKTLAEDLTSETFLKAIKSLDQFQGKSDIKVWLFQIAKNSYFSYLRKNHEMLELDQAIKANDSFNIEQSFLSVEESIRVHEILHQLEEPYKEVFSLRTFAELSFKQIGSLFGHSANWATVTYHRAKGKIRKKMEES